MSAVEGEEKFGIVVAAFDVSVAQRVISPDQLEKEGCASLNLHVGDWTLEEEELRPLLQRRFVGSQAMTWLRGRLELHPILCARLSCVYGIMLLRHRQ